MSSYCSDFDSKLYHQISQYYLEIQDTSGFNSLPISSFGNEIIVEITYIYKNKGDSMRLMCLDSMDTAATSVTVCVACSTQAKASRRT